MTAPALFAYEGHYSVERVKPAQPCRRALEIIIVFEKLEQRAYFFFVPALVPKITGGELVTLAKGLLKTSGR